MPHPMAAALPSFPYSPWPEPQTIVSWCSSVVSNGPSHLPIRMSFVTVLCRFQRHFLTVLFCQFFQDLFSFRPSSECCLSETFSIMSWPSWASARSNFLSHYLERALLSSRHLFCPLREFQPYLWPAGWIHCLHDLVVLDFLCAAGRSGTQRGTCEEN